MYATALFPWSQRPLLACFIQATLEQLFFLSNLLYLNFLVSYNALSTQSLSLAYAYFVVQIINPSPFPILYNTLAR